MTDARDTMRWVRRGGAIAALLIGWVFIAWQNRFHISAPVVFVCLGYLAVIATIYNLWRTGATAVDSSADDDDSTWAKPAGALGELEREKRTLLKAIKEAEFDHQMGKLSQRDADEMIRGYRVRAIEVIKQIDRVGLGAAGSVREQILREVRARVELDDKSPKKSAADGKAGARSGGAAKRGERADKAAAPSAGKPEPAGQATAGTPAVPASGAKTGAAADAASDAAGQAAGPDAVAASAAEPTTSAGRIVPTDDELDADSTTALESRHEAPAKEATP